MIRKTLFVPLLLCINSVSMQADYMIQLGLYKNRLILQQMIDRIAQTELKLNVIVEKRGPLHWAHSHTIEDKVSAQQTLLHYRKVFKDAFIKEVPAQRLEKQKNEQTDESVMPDQAGLLNSDAKNIKKRSLESWLKGNLFYVCFEVVNKELLTVAFDEDHVEYNTIIGDIPSFRERYDVVNDRLYIFKEKFSVDTVYSTLDEVQEKYLLISSWHQKEKINTVRYYYKLEDAITYVKED